MVPIADKVLPFFQGWMNRFPDCERLLARTDGEVFKYRHFLDYYFTPIMEKHGISSDHTPHWTRHTCASMMADAGISPSLQKLILGHAGAMSVTERVYTHIDAQTLVNAINQI